MRFASLVASLALSSQGALAGPAHSCVRIYQHALFAGSFDDVCQNQPNLASIGFDNVISSVEFGTNVNSVTFFDGANYQGDSLRATASVNRMGPLGFNDKATSMYIDFQSLPATAEPSADCVFVFEHGNFGGVATQFCEDVPDLSRFGFDNKITSIKLGSNVGRFTVYDLPKYAGVQRTRDASVDRFGPALSFNDRTSSLSFLLYSELPTHQAAIDGCSTGGASPEDVCLSVNDKAAVRCCEINAGDDCDSLCVNPATGLVENGFTFNFADALRLCSDANRRLCSRSEIDSCCGSGCGSNAQSSWVLEDCVDSCETNPCQNGGTCTNVFAGGFTCQCASGWEGPTCEQDVDDCSPNPCANGVCTDLGTNAYECACFSGWEGVNCDQATDVDDCAPNPCANGGVCTDLGTNLFACDCRHGFDGPTCLHRTHAQVSDGCKGAGIDVEDECLRKEQVAAVRCCNSTAPAPTDLTCTSICPPKYVTYDEAVASCAAAGLRLCSREEIRRPVRGKARGPCCGTGCNTNSDQTWVSDDCINYCDPHPCENGGTCFQGRVGNQPGFVCECTAGWSGRACAL